MTRPHPSLTRRVALAFGSFFSILSQPDFAAGVERLRAGDLDESVPSAVAPVAAAPSAPLSPAVPAVPGGHAVDDRAALQVLGLLQRDARFIDFIEEDIASYGDADIGAAARVVHAGCRKVVREYFHLEPVLTEGEGSRITLAADFDAAAIRLTGQVLGQAPFVGTLSHRGWRATETRLPQMAAAHDPSILAQAEVEL
ncbi:MAG: DUF2760 domain-containing protein [Burkholderiaceae bacterium]|nr:DUF2760 domain-containing protein [Burkholderiaceae bacterium]